jgi:hypothetical protein
VKVGSLQLHLLRSQLHHHKLLPSQVDILISHRSEMPGSGERPLDQVVYVLAAQWLPTTRPYQITVSEVKVLSTRAYCSGFEGMQVSAPVTKYPTQICKLDARCIKAVSRNTSQLVVSSAHS